MYWNRKWHVYYVVSKRLFFTIFFLFHCSQAFLTCVANLQTCCHTRMLWVVKATVNAVIINGKSVSIMQNKQDYHPMNVFQHARSFMITFEWYTCWDVHLSRQKPQTLFMFLLLLPDKKTTAENERGLCFFLLRNREQKIFPNYPCRVINPTTGTSQLCYRGWWLQEH